jgi:hypothetical protein
VIDKELYVGSATTALGFGFVTSPGKSRMESRIWLNGARLSEGDTFG